MTQQSHHIESIPISEIRVVNPRARNKVTFKNIVLNIENVGLKKPITVCRREPDADGTKYDLVCGQGRLEAFLSLGDTLIPAIVIDAPREERHLMSLVENIARRQPSNLELVREVRSLVSRGYTCPQIARKIGVHPAYINSIERLLRKGEEKLIAQVEAGTLPPSVAVKISRASSATVGKALQEAYESGALRGNRFRIVQTLIARRFAKERDAGNAEKMSSKDIVREYEKHTERHRTLVRRAGVVAQRLALLSAAMKRLLADDHFVTLLRAESLDHLPEPLAKRVA